MKFLSGLREFQITVPLSHDEDAQNAKSRVLSSLLDLHFSKGTVYVLSDVLMMLQSVVVFFVVAVDAVFLVQLLCCLNVSPNAYQSARGKKIPNRGY